jgi:hypothetical protein
MRLSAATAAVVTAAAITLAGAGAGTALASPLSSGTSSTAGTTSSTTSSPAAISEPGVLMLSNSSVRPGGTVSFSGTFAEPAAQTASGITVTSAAFTGPATLDRTDPEAFSGSGTVAAGTTPGTYTVTASSSAGHVSAKLTVTGATPVKPHHGHSAHGGTTSGGTGTGSDGGTLTEATDSAIGALVPAGTGSVVPWALGGLGMIALGGGAYALGRGRAADRSREAGMRDANWRNARDDDARTEVMHRR